MANLNVPRSVLRGSRGQRAHARTLGLSGGQGGGNNFIAEGESDLAGRDLAKHAGQAVINFIADDQKTEQRTFRLGTKVNRLHKSLEEMVCATPPVARVLCVQGPLEVLLCRFAG